MALRRRVLVSAEVSNRFGARPGATIGCVIEESVRRRVIVVLVAGVVLMLAYWTAWYADRSLVASNTRPAYYEFENAFPLADGWLTVALIGAAVSLRRHSALALLWLLAGGG